MKRYFYSLLALLGSVTGAFSQSKTITGGNDHGLIICAQGYLYTWGNNYSKVIGGPLLGIDPDDGKTGGNATKEFVTEPSRVKTDHRAANLTFSQVTAGSGAFNLALACNSVVYAWGENTNGGCGQGPSGSNVIKYPEPVLKGETSGYDEEGKPGGDYLGGVTYIAASTNSGFAIMDDGRVVGWGGGTWNGSTNKTSPVYIKVKQGNALVDLTNVTHISGGDDNCLIRTADGKLYGIGPWNGSTEEAVTVATPVLKEEDGEPLTDIRMSAAGDVCGFAVTGDGFVWSWGNGGWGGSTGVAQTGATHPQARKVSSGEYKTISKEEYLTDVKEVIGGRGHGAAVTKEGYLVYWGCNEGNGGVAPVAATTAKTWASGGQGVKPVLARYCDASGKPGEVVKNAVSISRGDNFDFMMNDEDKYFVWGLNDFGQCGVGTTVKSYSCLVELKTIPCDIQDNCPEVFMINQVKCPGEEIELDCGFVVPKGKEDRYFIQWSYNGTVLNSSTSKSSKADRAADKYNVQTIKITEPGTYGVVAEYIGSNIPCDKCQPAETEITVEDMPMPIDTVVTTMQCVAEPLKPTASDNVCFEATVNNKFYSAKDKVTFAAFSTVDSKDTLDVFETTGAGGKIKFCVSGDKILDIHDNKAEESNDTIYNVWLEDISKFETLLREGKPGAGATGGSFQSYGMLMDMRASADLISFDIYAKSYSGAANVTVTPVVYMAEKNENDLYVVGSVYWTGKEQTFPINDSEPNQCTVKCGVRIPGSSTRGIRYILGMKFTGNCTLYEAGVTVKQNSAEFPTPIIDSEKFGIYEMGATANSYTSSSNGSNKTCYYNVKFGKLTDYDCGRIMLSAQYGCPPCKRPDDIVTIEVDGTKHATANDTINLCEESPAVELSVSGIEATDGVFDELWFLNVVGADASALQATKAESASTLKTKIAWVAAKAGTTEKYYVKVRDNEKPEASACYVFDSIVVRYYEKPVAPAIDDIEFCENEEDKSALVTALSGAVFTPYEVNWYADAEKSAAASEPDLTTLAAKATAYEFFYSVSDKATSCESEVKSFTVTVNEVPAAPTTQVVPLLKEAGKSASIAAGATASGTNTLIWYKTQDMSSPSTTAPLQDLSEAGKFYYWVSQKSEAGCEGDTATVIVEVNDAPMPTVRDTMLCVGSAIADLSDLVTPLSSDYQLKWYDSESAEKGTGKDDASSFSATEAGETPFYVSQINTVTKAESEMAKFVVKVYDVKQPTVDNAAPEYCIGATADVLSATEVTEGDYFQSSGLEWFDEEVTAGATGSKTAFTPLTTKEGTKDYWVRQYYTLTSKDKSVCYGEPVKITVTVNATEKPTSKTNYTFNYLKTDVSNGQFVDLLTKDADGVIAADGCELIWYSDAAGQNEIAGTPAPTYDPTQAGNDRQEIFYVAQRNKATNCVSEIQKVVVNISDTPAPSGPSVTYCQNSPEVVALTATINTSVKSADNYELIWFTELPNANPVKDATNGSSVAPVPDVTVPAGELEVERIYYVAQKDLDSKAVSVASPISVKVYAKPVLTTDNASGYCYPQKVLLNNYYQYSSAVESGFSSTFYDEADQPLGGPEVSVSGLYHVTGQFTVPESNELCISAKEDINVTIDKLSDVKITASDRTCPNTSITLTASSEQNTSSVSYEWTSTNGDNGSTNPYVSKVMAGVSGDKYTFTLNVTAGACSASETHEVTIGDGRIEGSILISEDNNADWNNVDLVASDLSSVVIYTCGGELSLKPKMTKTEGDYTWSNGLGTGDVKVTESGVYKISYVNECPTSVDVTVVAVPLSATAVVTDPVICEDASSSIKLNYVCSEVPNSITWTKDGAPYATASSEILAFDPAKPSDSGKYVYTITNRGCKVTNETEPLKLTVKPYIKVTDITEPFIITRGEAVDMKLNIVSPAATEISSISWKEGASEVNSGETYSLTSVEADHSYDIVLHDDKYCDATTSVLLLVDAKLMLTTAFDDTLCFGESKVFTIDTTGTGACHKSPAATLSVVETLEGNVRDITNLFVENNGVMTATLSPTKDASYYVSFDYAGQHLDATEEIVVLQPIEIELPEVQMVCEGQEVTITLPKVSPVGTTIAWDSDNTITSGLTSESITVVAAYNSQNAFNHRSTYNYNFVASYAGCQNISMQTTLMVDEPISGEVTGETPICQGATTTLDASSFDAAEYVWTAEDDSTYYEMGATISAKLDSTRQFLLSMTRGTCTKDASFEVRVTSIPEIVSVDSISLRDRKIQLDPMKGTAPFQFAIDDENAIFVGDIAENLTFTSHMAYVVDAVGCKNSFLFRLEAPGIHPKGILTPEGDGVNDTWDVTNLAEVYPDAVVRIFDRYGKKLVEYKGSDTGWDGTYNGKPMPSTDYWYEIEIEEIEKTYVGHFTLMRR
ncbi:MAG: T9SS type B sorting domain-containing protein [Paludibacteraceae bacterium]|nr:T9SS type B sorting domain-containing protein [Paludibacteraceae bacterium]